jgi:hypothetical protein
MGTVKLDDDLLARYDQMATEFKQPLPQILERQLARFQDFPPTVRVVPLARDPLQQVEKLLGGGQIQSGQVLVDRVKSYSQAKLGSVEIDFSPAQKAELVHRAQKRGVTPEVVVKELVAIILDSAFDSVTPYR